MVFKAQTVAIVALEKWSINASQEVSGLLHKTDGFRKKTVFQCNLPLAQHSWPNVSPISLSL